MARIFVEHLQNNVDKLKLVAGEGDLRSYVEGDSLFYVELEVIKIHIHENFEHCSRTRASTCQSSYLDILELNS